MTLTEEELRTFLQRQEKRRRFSILEGLVVSEGKIPPFPGFLLRRLSRPLEYIGGVLLGIFLGIFTLIVYFVLFVMILHLSF